MEHKWHKNQQDPPIKYLNMKRNDDDTHFTFSFVLWVFIFSWMCVCVCVCAPRESIFKVKPNDEEEKNNKIDSRNSGGNNNNNNNSNNQIYNNGLIHWWNGLKWWHLQIYTYTHARVLHSFVITDHSLVRCSSIKCANWWTNNNKYSRRAKTTILSYTRDWQHPM